MCERIFWQNYSIVLLLLTSGCISYNYVPAFFIFFPPFETVMVLGEHLGLMLIGRLHRHQNILLVNSVFFCFRFTLAKYNQFLLLQKCLCIVNLFWCVKCMQR